MCGSVLLIVWLCRHSCVSLCMYLSVLGASGPVIKRCVSGKIMKVIKRQIIAFFRSVKWISSNAAVEKLPQRGERCVGEVERRGKVQNGRERRIVDESHKEEVSGTKRERKRGKNGREN